MYAGTDTYTVKMSFFNLTQLGYQDPIAVSMNTDVLKEPARKDGDSKVSKVSWTEPKTRGYSVADGSYVKYTQRLHKHQRPELGE